jgi:hypothetical protein
MNGGRRLCGLSRCERITTAAATRNGSPVPVDFLCATPRMPALVGPPDCRKSASTLSVVHDNEHERSDDDGYEINTYYVVINIIFFVRRLCIRFVIIITVPDAVYRHPSPSARATEPRFRRSAAPGHFTTMPKSKALVQYLRKFSPELSCRPFINPQHRVRPLYPLQLGIFSPDALGIQ